MYKSIYWILLPVCLYGVARADDLVLPDGAHWQLSGTSLHRSEPAPPLDATMNLYTIGVSCEGGLAGRADVDHPLYLPTTFYPSAFEQPDAGDGDAYATVCADLPPGVLVSNLQWKGLLAPADAASFRGLLEYLAQALTKNPPLAPAALVLFDPVSASITLDGKTGVWNLVRDRTTANSTTLVQLWPKAAIVMELQRAEAAQLCSTVGFDTTTPRPSWAPATFYTYGAHRDGAGFACLDGPAQRLVLISVTEAHLSPDDVQRVGAMLDAITTALNNSPMLAAPKPTAAPTP